MAEEIDKTKPSFFDDGAGFALYTTGDFAHPFINYPTT